MWNKICFFGVKQNKCVMAMAIALVLFLTSAAFAVSLIDLAGWWITTGPSIDPPFEIRQQGTDLALWDLWGTQFASGRISSDTIMIFMGGDTMTGTFSPDTLWVQDPGGNPAVIVRTSDPVWVPIRCGTIDIDGDTTDWSPDKMIADDPNNDATGNLSTEIDRFFLCHDQTYLYVRIDLVGDAAFPHSGAANDRYSIDLNENQQEYALEFWGIYDFRMRNCNTGQERSLPTPAISGRIMEGKVPLVYLGDMQKVSVRAQSEYFHSDSDKGFYDVVSALGEFVPCLCGDINGSGVVDITDVVRYISWVFFNGPAPIDGLNGDIDCDGRSNLRDIVYLVSYIFRGGLEPCAHCR